MNTAVCYASVVEEEAVAQIRRMCDHEFTRDSRIRIMPDVHAGKGCTIGTTMTVTDKAVPNIVGVDIGCGMYTVALGRGDIDMERLDAAARYIPSGMNVWEGRQERFDLTELRCYRALRDSKRLERSLGTLGGGNHFIEVDAGADGARYLVIHSGSRNLRKQVAEVYQGLDAFHTVHNYIDTREMILRKGAIAAHEGERVLIPINMRDGSVLAVGKGNPERSRISRTSSAFPRPRPYTSGSAAPRCRR